MNQCVWIMNHYAGGMFFNKGGRHYWFAKYLQREGYKPVVFCCNARHNKQGYYVDTDKLWMEQKASEIDTSWVFIQARTYANNGKDRVLNMLDFYFNLKKTAKEYATMHGKPDIILASSVHPLTLVAGIQLAKYFGVKCICEMRDLWPEAIVAYSSKLTRTHPVAKLLYSGEKWIYRKADALIFTQEGGLDYIREQGWDMEHGGPIDMEKAYHINNGVDLESFEENKKNFCLEDVDMDDNEHFKVVYAGAIRRINNLGIILDAAKKTTDPTVRYIIFGDGDELPALKQRVEDENINNVVFKGRINKQYIPAVVSRADVNVVHWEMNPLLRVGESYNKSFEYFAAGKPVFYTVRPNYSIVEKFKCGRLTDGFESKDLAAGIMAMKNMTQEEKDTMKDNAYRAAREYDFGNLTKKLIDIIEK